MSTAAVEEELENVQVALLQNKVARHEAQPASAPGNLGALGLAAALQELSDGCLVQDYHKRWMPAQQWSLLESGLKAAESETRKPPQDRRPVLWVHLHNFGGTFVCTEAIGQGEAGPPNAYASWPGCLMPGDECSTPQGSGRSLCQARAASGYTFTALERDVEEADFCNDVIIGTTLREPLGGVESTLLSNEFDKSAVLDILRTERSHAASHTACLPEWDTYQHFDNFATRSLGGGYSAPPRGVTREHLELAKSRLRKMGVVLILEELDVHLPQLSSVLGWNLALINTANHDHGPQQGHCAQSKDGVLTESDRAFLKSVNALDYELYAYAQGLAANLTALASKQ